MATSFQTKFNRLERLRTTAAECDSDAKCMRVLVKFRRNWDAKKHGRLRFAVAAWAAKERQGFSAGYNAATIALVRLTLGIEDPKRASEWAKALRALEHLEGPELRRALANKSIAQLGRLTEVQIKSERRKHMKAAKRAAEKAGCCLLYTSDAADE